MMSESGPTLPRSRRVGTFATESAGHVASLKHMDTTLRVFLCHASNDKEKVRTLHSRLSGVSGVEPWLDAVDILPGQNWDDEIRKAIDASHVVLVCLSPSSVTKEGYVQREIKRALELAEEKPEDVIFIVPLLLEPCGVPRRLQHLQWLNLSAADAFQRLLAALRFRGRQLGLTLPTSQGAWCTTVHLRGVATVGAFTRRSGPSNARPTRLPNTDWSGLCERMAPRALVSTARSRADRDPLTSCIGLDTRETCWCACFR